VHLGCDADVVQVCHIGSVHVGTELMDPLTPLHTHPSI
jgi:hypothetical protein